jgi:hypothetical protein
MKTAVLRLLLVPSATTFDRPRHHPPAFRMRDKEVRRFPVFNKEGRLGDLLSLSDFVGQADQEYTGGTANRQVTDAEVAALGKLCTGGCAERLAESGHGNRVQRMEVE